MAEETTRYVVSTDFVTEDHASPHLNRITTASQEAGRATDSLKRTLMRGLGAGAAFLGVRQAHHSLISVNDELERAERIMGATMAREFGGDIADNLDRAQDMVSRIHDETNTSAQEMTALAQASSNIVGPLQQAGQSMEEIEHLMSQATRLGGALGVDAGRVGQEIDQMLEGQVRRRSLVARQILSEVGMERDEFQDIDDRARRADIISDAFDSESMRRFIDEMDQGFSATMDEFRNSLEQTLGHVGRPLMEELTSEVQDWNRWLENNSDRVREMAESASEFLVEGFGMMKSAVEFLAEHSDTLITMGKIWAGVRIGRMAGGMLGNAARGIEGLGRRAGAAAQGLGTAASQASNAAGGLGGVASEAANAEGMLGRFAGSLGRALPVAGAASGLIAEIGRRAVEDKEEHERRRRQEMEFMSPVERFQAGVTERMLAGDEDARRRGLQTLEDIHGPARERGVITAAGDIDRDRLLNFMREMGAIDFRENIIPQLDELEQTLARVNELRTHEQLGAFVEGVQSERFIDMMSESFKRAFDPEDREDREEGPTNVNIQRVEVPARDPDRWIRDLGDFAAKQVRAPRAARGALRRGF